MPRLFINLKHILHVCVSCGACFSICPVQNIVLRQWPKHGILPEIIDPVKCGVCNDCLKVCPAYQLDYRDIVNRPGLIQEVLPQFGPILEIWEGHATDPEIRFKGSSGGAITALALYGLEHRGMHGVLHIGADPQNSVQNQTSLSCSRKDLLAKVGSRYAPASACDSLHLIEQAPAPCVFIGKPVEVAALRKAQAMRPELNRKTGLAISFFCAGSPTTQATVDLLLKMGVDPQELANLRYRGHGWPGHFAPTLKGASEPFAQMTYFDSWKFLQAYRPYAAHLWPDDSGESADVTCGDPWYREVQPGEPGSSLVVVRTERGREFVRGAMQAGYLELTPAEPWKLMKSQVNLANKRAAVWGRRLAFKAFGIPVTRLHGFPLFKLWFALSFKDKIMSTLGTVVRIMKRKYYRNFDALHKTPISVNE